MIPKNRDEIQVHSSTGKPPAHLPAAAKLFLEAATAGQSAVVVTAPAESSKLMAKRRHDLKAALRTLGFTVKALQTGYTFQDDAAAAKIEAIAKAVLIIEREGDLLLRVLPD